MLVLDETKHDLVDSIRREWTEYQTEIISEDWYIKQGTDNTDGSHSRIQPSYWPEAYGVAGIEYQLEESKFIRIDKYWLKVSFTQL